MGHTINFRTLSQVILFECEIKGQLSDGYWENSRPHDHWKVPCSATARVATNPELIGASFYPTRKYNFAARELLEAVGDRMAYFVKFYIAFPEVSFGKHWDIDFSDCKDSGEVDAQILRWLAAPTDNYYHQKAIKAMKILGVSTLKELVLKMAKVFAVPYSSKDLRQDLKEMSKTVQTFNRLIPR
jgi:hypothetical protein